MAVVVAAAFAVGLVAVHGAWPRAAARVALGLAVLAPGTVALWGALVPDAFSPGPSPASVPLPMAFTLALPPALLAVALRRGLRDDDRLLGCCASALALTFALLAWNEVAGGRAEVVPRTLVLLVPAATSLLLAVAGPGSLRGAVAGRLLPAAHLLGVLALLSREAWRLGEHLGEDAQQGAQTGVSICWALYATAALAAGISLRLYLLRAGALLLFGLTAGKLVFVDLAALPLPYRVLSFLALGFTLMGCGYLYHRFAARIGTPIRES
jgi:uncharacterized membrane protein